MNRTFFFSIVGLGVLSAAGFAGSRAQQPCVATCTASSPTAPVALVTQPDGQCVVARCVSMTACDPKAKAKAYTFTTQGGVAGGCGSSTTKLATSSGGLVAISGSGPGAAACGEGALAIPTQAGDVATVTVQGDASQASKRVHDLLEARASAPSALAEFEMQPVIVELDGDDSETWHADVERALAAAHGQYSVNHDDAAESWQRATEEAQAAQQHARKAYVEAVETYGEAAQVAQERSRETRERALVERRADADRAAQRSKRTSPRSDEKARKDHSATLEARVEALEEAARGRGQKVESKRSLEERVAQLEKLNATGLLSSESRLFKLQREDGVAGMTPVPRTFRWQSPKAAVPPVPPVPATPPTPRTAPTPRSEPAPFMELRRTRPDAPAPGAMRDEERADMARAMDELKREAKRLREELARMRAEVERLPRADDTR